MKFRLKATCCMITLMSLLFGAGSSALISITFETSLRQEKIAAQKSYRMILNTLQVVNRMEEWTDEKDISKILKQLSAQGSYWAALRLYTQATQTGSVYSEGTMAAHFIDLTGKIDTTHLACTIISAPDGANASYYLQLSSSFSVDHTVYYLDAAYDITSIYDARRWQQELYQNIFAILLAACAFFSYVLAYFLTRPLARLSKASREIACGNYDFRSAIKGSDEVSAVSRDFDLMADHLQQSMEELKDAMERQNRFVENFTHELKTPMTSIIGYADLLRSETLSKEDQTDAAGYIFSESRRLERLSLKLMDIFVMEHDTLKLSKASAAELADSLTRHLKSGLAQEQICLECDYEPGYCMLDTDLFGSLLVNLIENARKALPQGGTICVKTTMTPQGCLVTVTDNGKGIPKDSLAHITEAFYRVDRARSREQGGAGLGLTLCAEIAHLHHGTIDFNSAPEHGTTVTVELKGGRP